MKDLELTTVPGTIEDLELNFIPECTKSLFSDFKSKIKGMFKRSSRSNNYDAAVSMQYQETRGMTGTSSNLNGGINNMNFSKFDECLNNMPPMQRKVFRLRTLGGKSTALICKELNINESLFWDLIHQSRKELVIALNMQ